jgi:hypothetical protein
MQHMKWIVAVIGAAAVLLGGLWLLQGTGLVTIQPILCVADCEPLESSSFGWAIAGLVLLAAGVAAVWFAIGRRSRD